MKLYLIRHPQPDIAAGICYGGTDIAVSPDGVSAAAAALRPLLPAGADVYSSPLRRCTALADLLAGGRYFIDERLRELCFGTWEMRTWDDIPRAEIDAWASDPADYRPGGGESVHQMAQRVKNFYDDLSRSGTQDKVVICHAGTMRLLAECFHHDSARQMAVNAALVPRHFSYGGLYILPFGR